MDYFYAIIYGIIQGITEFLPVSSSGHLALLPKFFTFKDPGVFFDLTMHVGTALAVIVYFRREVFDLCLKTLKFHKNKDPYVANMLVASISTVILIFFIRGISEEYGRNPKLIGINLFIFGFLMFLADKFFKEDTNLKFTDKSLLKASVFIGLSQALAVFPGVSRSGATLTMARVFKISRLEASKFTFLLSLPIILAGFILKLPDAFNNTINFSAQSCLIGLSVSFVVGIITIHFFLKLVSKIGLTVFFIYRSILAALIIFY